MKNLIFHILFCLQISFLMAQTLTIDQIKNNLLENPPNAGNSEIREQSIIQFDNILKNDSSRTSIHIKNFYSTMMNKVKQDLHDSVSTASIWAMYNHGFVIKTPDLVFAFDLVTGYSGWPANYLPAEILSQIKILFVSHRHGDHYNSSIRNTVINNGGYVIVPSEESWMGNISMSGSDTLSLLGLNINAHEGLHSVPIRIFEVETPNNLKIVHTGDNQTSLYLPEIENTDVLLLNAWVNESGYTSAVSGMRNCLQKLNPLLMIPGHIQELAHAYNPSHYASRVPFEWTFEVDDIQLNSEVMVMVWGEEYEVPENMVSLENKNLNRVLNTSFHLYQNYPNPFNPATKITFTLPKTEKVILQVYNILGQIMSTLIEDKLQPGAHEVEFNAGHLPGGVYFYKLQAGEYMHVKKMIVLK